jgi:hypothetical protein
MGKHRNTEDPRKNRNEPAEEQQFEQHSSVDEDTNETAQVIEDDKLEYEKRKSEKSIEKDNSFDRNVSASEKHLEDRDDGKLTNKDDDIVNKKGQ